MANYNYNYDIETNIQLALGFKLGQPLPVDLRSVVNTIAQRDAHITLGRAYPGMLIYVTGPDSSATAENPVGVTYRLDSFEAGDASSASWSIMANKAYVDSQVAAGGGIVLLNSASELDESTGNPSKLYITLDEKQAYLFKSAAAAGSKFQKLNADAANKLVTARKFSISGDVLTGVDGAVNFDGTGDVNLAVTLGSGVVSNINVSSQAAIAQSKIAGTGTGKTLVDDLNAKLDDSQLRTSVRAAASASDTEIASEKAVRTELDKKVDAEEGKGLSSNDYTTEEKNKLSGIEAGADVNVIEGVSVKHNGSEEYVDLTITNKKAQLDISDYALKSEVAGALVYKGGKTGAELAALTASDVKTGWFYTCTTGGSGFQEGFEYAATVNGNVVTWTELGHYIDTSVFVQKTQKVNNKALSGDITLDGADVALTNYAKGSSDAAIVATDTINAAFGKVENQVDKVAGNLSTHAADTGLHVTSALQESWTAKYDKPADGIPKSDLDIGVKDSLNLADSAVQSITTGTDNGTIKVDNTDVSVKGLKSAAYTESTDYATAAQGAKADTAVQPTDTVITNKELLANKVKSTDGWSATLSDDKYPSEKLVKESLDNKVEKEEGKGLSSNDYTTTEKNKLAAISAGANKVEASDTNGNIKIDGTETNVYTHPAEQTAHESGLYKITTNTEGHVTGATAAAKADLTSIIGDAVGTGEGTSGIMTAAQAVKLAGVEAGATKVEASDTNGKIKINGTETTVYTHPTTTAVDAAFVKVGKDASGHVVLGNAVAKADITGVVGAVSTDTDDLGMMTAADKTKLNGIATGAQVNVIESLKINDIDATISNKAASVTIPAATTTASGVMSASDKLKLDGIAEGAEANVLESVKVNGTALTITNKAVDVTVTTGDATSGNGTIKVNGAAVSVYGLKSAAYTESTDYATAAQGTKADSALQKADITTGTDNGTIAVDGTDVAVKGLGSAAYKADTYFVAAETGKRLMTDAEGTKLEGIATGAQVNVLEGVQVNGTDLSISSKKVNVTIATPTPSTTEEIAAAKGKISVNGSNVAVYGLGDAAYAAIANNVTTTTAGSVLDATQGKALADRIANLEARGRYLSIWYSDTGLPADNPPESALVEGKYPYKSGDYYVVGRVDTAATPANKRPAGSSYTPDVASTTAETLAVGVGDYYLYDGTSWRLLQNTQKTITIAQVEGLQTALDAKALKTTTVNGQALSANVTLDGADIEVTGYTKAGSKESIAVTDTINEALGKLEYKVDNAEGTVSSVGLSMPSIFTVTGSPITSSGTLSATLNNQNANVVFAGPSSGDAAAPTFRSLVSDDIPALAIAKITGLQTALDNKAAASDLTAHTSDSDIHVTAAKKEAWDAKYDKPADGIPSTDMTAAVQASLAKADSAIQDISGKMDKIVAPEGGSIPTGNAVKINAAGNVEDAGFAAANILLSTDTIIWQCALPTT